MNINKKSYKKSQIFIAQMQLFIETYIGFYLKVYYLQLKL